MLDYGTIGLPFGCYFGMVFEACQFPRMHTLDLKDETWWKRYVRFLITLLICIPVLLLGEIPGQYNIYLMSLFKMFLPTFFAGFIIYGVADYVNKKLNLLKFESDERSLYLGEDKELAL